MILTNLNDGPKATYSLSGTKLTVEGVTVDLATRQTDVQQTINISLANDLTTAAEGVGSWYIATIVIPPKSYDVVDTGTKDAQGNEIMTVEAQPLDMSKVELRLWALPQGFGQATSQGVTA